MDEAIKRITQAATGERTVFEKIEALGNAALLRYPEMTKWEIDFANDICDRWYKYEDRLRLSDKQREIIDRIHAKISHYMVI